MTPETISQTCSKNLLEVERVEKIDKINKSIQELSDFISIDMQRILNPPKKWKD